MSDCSPLPYSFTPSSWWWSQAKPRHKQCHFIVMSSRPQEGRRRRALAGEGSNKDGRVGERGSENIRLEEGKEVVKMGK